MGKTGIAYSLGDTGVYESENRICKTYIELLSGKYFRNLCGKLENIF